MIIKILIAFGVLLTGTVFLLPKHLQIEGTWVLNNKEKAGETAVLRIQLGEGYYLAKLDIPGQQVFDKPVSLQIKGDSIMVRIDEKEDCFIEAQFKDSLLTGRSVVDGRAEDVSFRRLKN